MPLTLRIPGRIVFTVFRSFRLQTQGGPPADFNRRAVKLTLAPRVSARRGGGSPDEDRSSNETSNYLPSPR